MDDTPDGYFLMGNLTDLRMSASKNLFEPVEFIANPDILGSGRSCSTWACRCRRSCGSKWAARRRPTCSGRDDVEYQITGETFCQPCRLVRLVTQTSGTMRIHVTWTDVTSTLNLWVNGQMFPPTAAGELVAEVPITRGNELIVYPG